MLASVGEVVGILIVAGLAVLGLVTLFASRFIKIVQQGSVGVVKRLGEFKAVKQPGLHILAPFVDRMDKVDVREFPMTGDQQAVITKDNVSLQVSATIFCQVIDVKSALFEINDFQLAVDQLSRTALRAVFGELSLDQALSERETDQQPHAGPHGRRHGQVGRAAQPDRDPRHHAAHERGAGDVRAEGGRAAQARRHSEVGG